MVWEGFGAAMCPVDVGLRACPCVPKTLDIRFIIADESNIKPPQPIRAAAEARIGSRTSTCRPTSAPSRVRNWKFLLACVRGLKRACTQSLFKPDCECKHPCGEAGQSAFSGDD
jgi:hypothetical protein